MKLSKKQKLFTVCARPQWPLSIQDKQQHLYAQSHCGIIILLRLNVKSWTCLCCVIL